MLGPGLGGGFGRYQGYFGLVTDNIIDMNVVLADGSITTVSSTVKPDLYWAMRGAGHNFGIVTHFTYRIHDAPVTNWYVETMVFTQDKLEQFFELSNKIGANGAQEQRLVLYSLFAMNPQISKTMAISLPSSTEVKILTCASLSSSWSLNSRAPKPKQNLSGHHSML